MTDILRTEADTVRLLRMIIKDGHRLSVARYDCNQFGQARGNIAENTNHDADFTWEGLPRETVVLLADVLRAAAASGQAAGRGGLSAASIERIGEVLGDHLYQLLFQDEVVHRLLRDGLDNWERGNLAFLRIELEFAGDAANELASLPWEYVRLPPADGGSFLVHLSQLVLNRRLHLNGAPELRRLNTEGPLRVLLVAASPPLPEKDGEEPLPAVSAVEVYRTLTQLKAQLGNRLEIEPLLDDPSRPSPGQLDPNFTAVATRKALSERFEQGNLPHVVHFLGHGRRNPTDRRGQLALTGQDGRPHWINEDTFATLVCDNRELRLAILQACESALPSRYVAGASGVASHIAARRIPAVVAMQFSIEAASANNFAAGFYRALLGKNPVPVDVAVRMGRREMLAAQADDQQSAASVPVVYLLDYNRLMAEVVTSGVVAESATQQTGMRIDARGTHAPCPRCTTPVAHDDLRCGECSLLFECPECHGRWNPMAKRCTKCPDKVTYLNQPPWDPQQDAVPDTGFVRA